MSLRRLQDTIAHETRNNRLSMAGERRIEEAVEKASPQQMNEIRDLFNRLSTPKMNSSPIGPVSTSDKVAERVYDFFVRKTEKDPRNPLV